MWVVLPPQTCLSLYTHSSVTNVSDTPDVLVIALMLAVQAKNKGEALRVDALQGRLY